MPASFRLRVFCLALACGVPWQNAHSQADGQELLREYRSVEHTARTLIHFDYRLALAQASEKKRTGLRKLFWFTGTDACKGAAAQEHGEALRAMLTLWGDEAFARELSAEPPALRRMVVATMEQVWPAPGWRAKQNPKTYNLGEHAS